MNRRLLLVATSMMRGGAEIQVFQLARSLAARGHVVRIVSLRDPEDFQEELADLGVLLDSLGMRSGRPDPRALNRLASIVRSFRPDVVHSHMVHANLLTRLTRPLARMPVLISTAHSFNEGARWRELAYRITDPLCDLSTNVCHAAVERFVAVGAMPRHRIECVWNGIDLRDFDTMLAALPGYHAEVGSAGVFTWLAVGNLGPAKDYPNLLRAMRLLVDVGEPANLVIAGRAPTGEAEALERIRRDLGLDRERVRNLGPRTDVPALMRAADGMVMSSAWEGLPLALIEAAAAGLPIVATNVGGNPEVVIPERSGLLVPPWDARALAAAMRRVAALPVAERRAWGAVGRAHVERHFDIERIVDHWEAIYARLSGLTWGRADGGGPAA